MDKEPHIIPDVAVKGIATGLVMMAAFTLIWAGIAFGGLHESNYWFVLLVFPVFSVVFVINADKVVPRGQIFSKGYFGSRYC